MKSSGYIATLIFSLASSAALVFGAGGVLFAPGESSNLVWSNDRMSAEWADAAFVGNGQTKWQMDLKNGESVLLKRG
jgi:hypothetical protein